MSKLDTTAVGFKIISVKALGGRLFSFPPSEVMTAYHATGRGFYE